MRCILVQGEPGTKKLSTVDLLGYLLAFSLRGLNVSWTGFSLRVEMDGYGRNSNKRGCHGRLRWPGGNQKLMADYSRWLRGSQKFISGTVLYSEEVSSQLCFLLRP